MIPENEVKFFVTHQPVLLQESVQALAIKPNGIYVDATFGCGGHSRAILDKLSDDGRLFVIDKDPEAILTAKTFCSADQRIQLLEGSFSRLKSWMQAKGLLGKVNGILLDLGVSSPQLDKPDRGFSFLREGPLDMRMNPNEGESAAEFIRTVSEDELSFILKEYGDERYAKRIAHAVVTEREKVPIVDTKQLADIVKKANPRWERRIHPATRTFLAIRIFINRELEELAIVLQDSLDILVDQGRLVVISFHSKEDRMVKQFIKKQSKNLDIFQQLGSQGLPRLRCIEKKIRASEEEQKQNPRARSALLRVAEKISSVDKDRVEKSF